MNARAEKVARMFGKTTYKDFRQGFAQVNCLDADPDSDIKVALGIVQHRHGHTALMALETFYASTLDHERELRRAWDTFCGVPDDPQRYPIRRLGCSIAIREHAHVPMSQREVKEWAWMLHTRSETVDAAIRAAMIWLENLTTAATATFVATLREKD
jgi:hypothetical protein